MDCGGMSRVIRVIFTWYKYDGNKNLVSMNSFQVVPFARFELSDGYPCIIWFSILYAKENLNKALNDAWLYPDMRKFITFQLSMESSYYFSNNFHLVTLFVWNMLAV
jgi:hypothetical protein